MATKKVKKSNVEKTADNIKVTAKNIHDGALKVSENLVEGSLATGSKWQKIMAKAITEGNVLFGKQQDMLFDTLEEIKEQYISSNKRFRKLFGFDIPSPVKAKKAVVKKAEKTVEAVKTKAKKVVKPVAKKVNKKATKVAGVKTSVKADNLKAIDGVGPKIATLLNEAGIKTFAQMASANIKDLQAILDAAGPRFKMHDPKTWRIQAKRLMK